MRRQKEEPAHVIEQDSDGTRIIHTGGLLRAKAAVRSSKAGGVDEMSLAAADAAMKDLASDFRNWMGDEVNRLVVAYENFRDSAPEERNVSSLMICAHDLRGQAATFGYPIAAEIAESLANLLDKIEPDYLPMQLVSHHVDAVRAIFRNNIRDYANPVAMQIIHNLRRAINRVVELRQKAKRAEVHFR